MTTRNKILLSVGAVCLVAVIAVVAVVAVFAARTQNVSSNISVKYTAKQVVGRVSAKYYLGSSDSTGKAMYKEDGETDYIGFTAGSNSETGTLQPKDNEVIDLSNLGEDELFVVFEYKFENQGKQDFTVGLTFNGTTENVKVYVFGQADTVYDTKTWTNQKGTLKEIQNSQEVTLFDGTDTVKNTSEDTGSTYYCYVVVSIDETASGADASFSGDFTWTLNAVAAAA